MTHGGDPERSYQAQRAGIFARLNRQEHVNELQAEHLIVRWEREAEAAGRPRGSLHYWKVDKTDMNAEGDDGQVFGG
jgi:hypothetical protein